ncbi:MAG: hypothetical protein RL115_807 [Bacteroidota bacterium]
MSQNSNPIAGLHKSKMYSLILAGLALVSLILPWFSVKASGGFGFSVSKNGFGSWGLLALIGAGVAIASCFMGDKTKGYDDMGKKLALGGFGAIAGGAVIYLIRILTVGNGGNFGVVSVKASPGIGLFIGLAAGALGLLILLGMVKPPKSIDDKIDSLS